MGLRLVDPSEVNMKRVFIAGHREDFCAFNVALSVLKREGYVVANEEDGETTLRTDIALLTTCDAICLLEDWWTFTEAHYLQSIAAWLRLAHIDPKTGREIATVSLKGVRA